MADTGFRRFKEFTDANGAYTGEENLVQGGNGNCTTSLEKALTLTLLDTGDTAKDDLGIPEGSVITGIEFRISAKYAGSGTTPGIEATYTSNVQPSSVNDFPASLTTTFADYTIGGDGNLFGRRVNEELIVPSALNLTPTNPSSLTITIEGSESGTTPAYKVYYDPPPATTLNTGWVKFGANEEDSNNWAVSNPSTSLLSGQTGAVAFLSSNAPFYFIFKTPDSFNVPSDATVTGIQFRGEFAFSAPTTINGKLSLSDFSDSAITDNFFSLATGVDPTSNAPYITGSYNNLFGLTPSPSDLSDLYLGIKIPTAGGSFGTITGTTEAPAVKIFYTPRPTISPHLLINLGRLSITSGKLSLSTVNT